MTNHGLRHTGGSKHNTSRRGLPLRPAPMKKKDRGDVDPEGRQASAPRNGERTNR